MGFENDRIEATYEGSFSMYTEISLRANESSYFYNSTYYEGLSNHVITDVSQRKYDRFSPTLPGGETEHSFGDLDQVFHNTRNARSTQQPDQ